MSNYRSGLVYIYDVFAGIISECEDGYEFKYDTNYLRNYDKAVSLNMPLQEESYISSTLFPFSDGLIPEGYLLNITSNTWKIPMTDRFIDLVNERISRIK